MSYRCLAVVLVTIVMTAWPVTPASAQGRTPWGDPDIQGTWTNATTTPLQRPAEATNNHGFDKCLAALKKPGYRVHAISHISFVGQPALRTARRIRAEAGRFLPKGPRASEMTVGMHS